MSLKWWQRRRRKLGKIQFCLIHKIFALGIIFKKSLSNPGFQKFSPVFLRSFIVLYRVWIEGFLCLCFFVVAFSFLAYDDPVISAPCWKAYPFFSELPFHFCWKLIDYVGLGQFLYCVLFQWSIYLPLYNTKLCWLLSL